jgi:hypothetical protein
MRTRLASAFYLGTRKDRSPRSRHLKRIFGGFSSERRCLVGEKTKTPVGSGDATVDRVLGQW